MQANRKNALHKIFWDICFHGEQTARKEAYVPPSLDTQYITNRDYNGYTSST